MQDVSAIVRTMGRKRQLELSASVLGQNLLRIRTEKRMSQEELAERSGISRTTIWRLEAGTGSKKPSISTIEALAGALKVKTEDLWQVRVAIPVLETAISSFVRSHFAGVLRPALNEDDLSRLRAMTGSIWINVQPSDEVLYYLVLAHRASENARAQGVSLNPHG